MVTRTKLSDSQSSSANYIVPFVKSRPVLYEYAKIKFIYLVHLEFWKLVVKWKGKKYHTVGTFLKSNRKIAERFNIDTFNCDKNVGQCQECPK